MKTSADNSELFVFTAGFPFNRHDFLAEEVWHLARSFDSVRLIPIRPKGHQAFNIPENVQIDLTLAAELGLDGNVASGFASRNLKRLRLLSSPRMARECLSEARRDGLWKHREWIPEVGLQSANRAAVQDWASKMPPPDVSVTVWLGATTLGLRRAWPTAVLASRAHGGDYDISQKPIGAIPYIEETVHAPSRIFAVSEHARSYLMRYHGLDAQTVSVSRLGIADLGGLTPRSTDGVIRILSVSSVDSIKRVTLIAEAIEHVRRTGQTAQWTHIGEGPDMDRLTLRVEDLGLSDSATLLGQLPQAQVRALIRTGPFDCFVNASSAEGAPVSLMEAQCVGLPTVATDVGASGEVISGDLDLLVESSCSASELATAIILSSKSPLANAPLRRERWEELYSSEVNSGEFAATLRSLVPPRRR